MCVCVLACVFCSKPAVLSPTALLSLLSFIPPATTGVKWARAHTHGHTHQLHFGPVNVCVLLTLIWPAAAESAAHLDLWHSPPSSTLIRLEEEDSNWLSGVKKCVCVYHRVSLDFAHAAAAAAV